MAANPPIQVIGLRKAFGAHVVLDDVSLEVRPGAAVALDRVADERVRTFSLGMKRRLALARVVLARPPVLLLDEPHAGLDQRAGKWLDGHLGGFKAAGGAILMTTHSFGRGLGVADRIAILTAGRLAFDAPLHGLTPDDVRRLYELHAENGG